MTDNGFYFNVIEEARERGIAAALGMTPRAMIVGEAKDLTSNEIDYSKKTYYVADGVCGFAWIWFKGNTKFGRWAKKNGLAKSWYPTGLAIWVSEFGQSYERKMAYAREFAKVLNEYGIKDAYASGRLD